MTVWRVMQARGEDVERMQLQAATHRMVSQVNRSAAHDVLQ